MSKKKLVFMGYEEHWDDRSVSVTVKGQFDGLELKFTSMPVLRNTALGNGLNFYIASEILSVVERALEYIGKTPKEFGHSLPEMLKQFDVFVHQDFRAQCEEYEVPYKHLLPN